MDAARAPRRLTVVPGGPPAGRRGGIPAALAARYARMMPDARVVLDVGCGAGDFGRLCPSPGVQVHGVDVDPRAVELASQHERALVVDLDARPLPYPEGMFDAVLAKDIFEHVRDPARLARECRRVMRPDAVLVASMVMARSRRVWDDYTHLRGFTRRSACQLLEDAGFSVEDVWRMGGVPLTARLNLIHAVPHVLRMPLFDALWGSSWEVRARR